MRTINATYERFDAFAVVLGKRGENGVSEVSIDVSRQLAAWPDASFGVAVETPGEVSYPGVTVLNGTKLVWSITGSDTAEEGMGRAQVVMYGPDGEIGRSPETQTVILPSVTGDGEAPAAVQAWMDAANALLEELRNNGVSEEQIAAAVDSYLANNPIEGVTETELSQALAAYLPLAGGRLTGSLNLGHVQSRDSVLLTLHRQGSDGVTKWQLQNLINDADGGSVAYYKNGATVNRMVLTENSTTFGKPVDIAGGGHGGTTAAEARANLDITPANIGALPMAGGTMSGNLTVGNGTEGNAPMLLLKRLMTDGATNGSARLYMTASGNLKIDLFQGDTRVNSWTLAPDTVTEIPTKLPSPGVLTLTGAVSGTYDGSADTSIEIPAGGSSAGIKSEIVRLTDVTLTKGKMLEDQIITFPTQYCNADNYLCKFFISSWPKETWTDAYVFNVHSDCSAPIGEPGTLFAYNQFGLATMATQKYDLIAQFLYYDK